MMQVLSFIHPDTPINRLVIMRYLRIGQAQVRFNESKNSIEVECRWREIENAIISYCQTCERYGITAFDGHKPYGK